MPEQFCRWTYNLDRELFETECGATYAYNVAGEYVRHVDGLRFFECLGCGKPIQQEDGALEPNVTE